MLAESKTVAFYTLGCKLNYAETSTIARKMEQEGFRKVGFNEVADVYVINTCTVTENADKECRTIVRKALRISPNAKVVIIGCYAQLKPDEISAIEGVDLVLGAKEKFNLATFINALPAEKKHKEAGLVYSCDINDISFFQTSYSFGERTRAFLKVQDGCDYSCTYCTIPLARGKSRSDTVTHVIKQAKEIAALGIKEIVLTGVNIGDFGIRDIHSETREESFFDLLKALDKVEGVERFRISSIEPNLLKDEIIEFVSVSKRFMPHFHIPLQSGSDVILKRMKRRYLRNLYSERVAKIKAVMPHCCIGADVIVGFPGETDKLFKETYNFLNELDISYLHVFTYSERDNTEAADMKDAVPMNVRHERSKMLRILSEKKRTAFYRAHLGQTRPALFESEIIDGMNEGYTDNYIKVTIPATPLLIRQMAQVTLLVVNDTGIEAQLLNSLSHSPLTFEAPNHIQTSTLKLQTQ